MTNQTKIAILMGLAWSAAGAIASGQSTPKFTTLYTFSGGNDGNSPVSGVTIGQGGVLYGTTLYGGTLQSGVAFALTPPANTGGAWTEQVLYNFNGATGDLPYSVLVRGPNGVLYGSANGLEPIDNVPRNGLGSINYGAFYSLKPPSGDNQSWQYDELISFGEGFGPGTLFKDTSGGFYSSVLGSPTDSLIALTPPASPGGTWTESTLYTFTIPATGGYAAIDALSDSGVFYGSTFSQKGAAVFSLTPPALAGGNWTLTGLSGLASEVSGLTIGDGGVLYGTTISGGGDGSVFAVIPPASGSGPWTTKEIFVFNSTNGSIPTGGFVMGRGGVLYGVTESGGEFNYGTVYALDPPASLGGPWTQRILHSFTNGGDGGTPVGLTPGADGVLYGVTAGFFVTYGSVFELQP